MALKVSKDPSLSPSPHRHLSTSSSSDSSSDSPSHVGTLYHEPTVASLPTSINGKLSSQMSSPPSLRNLRPNSHRQAMKPLHPSEENCSKKVNYHDDSSSPYSSQQPSSSSSNTMRRSNGILNLDKVGSKKQISASRRHSSWLSSAASSPSLSLSFISSPSSLHISSPENFESQLIRDTQAPPTANFGHEQNGLPMKRPLPGIFSENNNSPKPAVSKYRLDHQNTSPALHHSNLAPPHKTTPISFDKSMLQPSASSTFSTNPSSFGTLSTPQTSKIRKMNSMDILTEFPKSPFSVPHHLANPSIHALNHLSKPTFFASPSPYDPSSSNRPSSGIRPSSSFSFAQKPKIKLNSSITSELPSSDYSTPESYKQVKPLQTAFMSTGLISKRNRKKNNGPYNESYIAPPDTPCKRPSSPQVPSPVTTHGLPNSLFTLTPENPANHTPSLSNPGGLRDTRLKFNVDAKAAQYNSSRLIFEYDLPPTPTKDHSPHIYDFDAGNQNGLSLSSSIPTPASKIPSDASTIRPSSSMVGLSRSRSTLSAGSNGGGSLSQGGGRVLMGTSPSDRSSSPHTPDVPMHSETTQLSLSMHNGPDSGEADMANIRLADADHDYNSSGLSSTGTEPKTPAKTPKTPADPLLHSMLITGSGQRNDTITDPVLNHRFSSVSLIGKGEFSLVYAVSERSSSIFEGNRYAIKRTKFPFLGPKARSRKLEEVEVLRSLTLSENDQDGKEYIINLIDNWEMNGHLYIMTEYCENGNLDTFLLERGNISRLDEWRVWKILVELALGLRFIHNEGYIHLDIKPANVFITFEGTLKIGDFGMATKYPAAKGIEREGDREYIAPEVLSRQNYDKPADIFSFGLVMLEIAANIVLPDNGIHWQKLRSGDLSEAGRLSSGDLSANNGIEDYNSELTNNKDQSSSPPSPHPIRQSVPTNMPYNVPDWAPKFMVDNKGALDNMVKWMLDPDLNKRPTANEILMTEAAQWVDTHRKAGAVIYEGDFGPEPDTNPSQSNSDEMSMDDDLDINWRREM